MSKQKRQALLDEAERQFEAKNIDGAEELYQRILSDYPDWNYAAHASMMIGVCYDHRYDRETAAKWFERTIEQYNHLEDFIDVAVFYLAETYSTLGRKDEARRAYHYCLDMLTRTKDKGHYAWRGSLEGLRAIEAEQSYPVW